MKDADPFCKSQLSAITRLQDGRFVVGGSHGTIAVSADQGHQWRRIRLDPKHDSVDVLRIRQVAAGTLYALTIGGLFASDDGGESWRAVPRSYSPGEPFPAEDIAVAADGESLLVTTCEYNTYSGEGWSALCRSRDGVKWTTVRFSENAFFTAVAELADGSIILGNRACFNRFDGQAWHSTNSQDVCDIVVDGERICMSTYADVRLSTNAGQTWSQLFETKLGAVRRIAVDGDRVCAVSNGDVFTSIDAGENWTWHQTDRVWRAVALTTDGAIVVGNDGAVERMPLT
jgi:photosystem II stability/assembly factor-like uncharacterized protein